MMDKQSLQQRELGIAADASLCHCLDDPESAIIGLFCPAILFGQTRQQTGQQGCIAGCCTFLLPMIVLQLGGQALGFASILGFADCLVDYDQCRFPDGSGSGSSGADCETCKLPWQLYAFTFGGAFAALFYLTALLGHNRTVLQQRLGLPAGGACNYCLYNPFTFQCIGLCVLCQESRAVKQRWLDKNANNRTGIAQPIMPVQPGAGGGGNTDPLLAGNHRS